MVDFGVCLQGGENQPAVQDGLAREGNLDILMAWGRIVTYWYSGVKIVDFKIPKCGYFHGLGVIKS